jgi:PucR family transcriptional regulator, purine catabolism regulatory protein
VIRLSELLAQRELGLRPLAGAEDAERVEVRSAEVCELPDPRPWLDSGAMLLTTGVALGHGAHVQRLLVERTVEARAAAIGFSVGLVHPQVPDPVRESCEQLGLPLIAIPAATPFRMVLAAVAERTAPGEHQGAQRTLAMQTYLMEALSAPEPEAELLRRLGSLLSGTALLADETGAIEGAPNAALPHELWGPLRGGKGVRLHHLRGVRYVTAPVADRMGARRWLVVAGPASGLPDRLARQALQSAERLARLIDRARPPRPAEARAVRAELAAALLGWRAAGDRRQLAHRAAALGLGVEEPLHVSVLRLREGGGAAREARSQRLARVRAEVEGGLTTAAQPFLAAIHEGDLVLVAPAQAATVLDAALQELAGGGLLVDMGVGRAAPSLDGLPRSWLDGRFAVVQLAASPVDSAAGASSSAGADRSARHVRRAGPPTPRTLTYDDFDLATTVVCDADPAALAARRETLRDAQLDGALRETLHAYLEHRLDVPRTAAALHLHPNSVRYRLSRIERELGRTLDDPVTIANLYLAGLIDRAGGAGGAAGTSGEA